MCNQSHRLAAENYHMEMSVALLQKALPVNLTSLNTRGVGALISVLGGSFTKGGGGVQVLGQGRSEVDRALQQLDDCCLSPDQDQCP